MEFHLRRTLLKDAGFLPLVITKTVSSECRVVDSEALPPADVGAHD